jgi:bifunctional DNA-binding transcriptional regulator/antitoxin component of YhaV-PrlF toxin-antitoxin module
MVYDREFFDSVDKLRRIMVNRYIARALGINRMHLVNIIAAQRVSPYIIERSRQVFPELFKNPPPRTRGNYGKFWPNNREKLAAAEDARRNQERADRLRAVISANADRHRL